MKKFLLTIVSALTICAAGNAQAIYGYGLSINSKTYTEITNGTVIASGTDEAIKTTTDESGEEVNNFNEKIIFPSGIFSETTTAPGYPIGFDFILGEAKFNSFGISTNGAIFLGNDEVCIPVVGRYAFTTNESANFIGFVGNRGTICNDNTQISYTIKGEAPLRTLIVQFKQIGILKGFWGTDAYFFDFQIHLYEETNNIEFIMNGAADAMVSVNESGETEEYNTNIIVGVKETEDKATCVIAGNMESWEKQIGTSNTFTIDKNVIDGTTFVFSAPTDVITPEAQPTNLIITQYSTKLYGTFSPTEKADKYLVVYQPGKEITTLPVDKTTYASGEMIGEATVVEYTEIWDSTDFEFEITNLTGAIDYTIAVYAVNAYGTNGPAYNTTNPLTAVTYTNPLAPTVFEFVEIGDNTAKINLTANESGNKVLVAYTQQLVRSNFGDYPLIGVLEGEYEVGAFIEGGGTVGYFGDAGESIEISNLEHSNGYYFVAVSYDPIYGYSTDNIEVAAATLAHLPYKLDISVSKHRDKNLPPGWHSNEGSTYQVPTSISGYTTEENPYMMQCRVATGNATEGIINTLTSCPIVIDQRDAVVKFDYTIYHSPSRFSTEAYNEWNEKDVFAIQVSTDNGETFTDLVKYTSENNPTFEYGEGQLLPFEGELAEYEGQTIIIRIYWHLFNATFTSGNLIISNFHVEGREIPETPIVKVEDITHLSAKVVWRGAQENYEVAFAKSGEEFTTQVVEGATELAFNDLEAETEYQVKVRGIAAENDYSYWSEVVTFTTNAWPECEAPTNLEADLSNFETDGTVVLTWEGNNEHLTWDVRYRDGASTSWNTTEGLDVTTLTLEGLDDNVTYLWNVRAACIADRTTAWSAQGSFTTPELNSIDAVESGDFKVYTQGGYLNVINSGVYVNRITVYSADGSILAWVDIDGYDNAIIPVKSAAGVIIVKVETADGTMTYKNFVK